MSGITASNPLPVNLIAIATRLELRTPAMSHQQKLCTASLPNQFELHHLFPNGSGNSSANS